MTTYLRQYVAKKIADTRSDADMSQGDLEKKISEILKNEGLLQVLRDFVSANIAFYRNSEKQTLADLSSNIDDVEKLLRRMGYSSGSALDKSKLSKTEQPNGRSCPAEELFLISAALNKPIKHFFPPEPTCTMEKSIDPLADYELVRSQDGISEYRHCGDRAKIAVIFVAKGMSLNGVAL